MLLHLHRTHDHNNVGSCGSVCMGLTVPECITSLVDYQQCWHLLHSFAWAFIVCVIWDALLQGITKFKVKLTRKFEYMQAIDCKIQIYFSPVFYNFPAIITAKFIK